MMIVPARINLRTVLVRRANPALRAKEGGRDAVARHRYASLRMVGHSVSNASLTNIAWPKVVGSVSQPSVEPAIRITVAGAKATPAFVIP